MINLFRKARVKLLKENRLGSYLIYAAGEIVLVVLGILIALKINSMAQERINKQLERDYLTAISENVNEDIEELQERMSKDSIHLQSYTQLIQAFSVDSIRLDENKMKYIIHNSAIINYFNPQNTVFEEMKSSGKLYLIRSKALRFEIMEYYNHSQRVVTSQKINNEVIMNNQEKSIDKHLDLNSLVESQLPQQWNSEIDTFDITFFYNDLNSPEVQSFAQHISLMKAGVWINHNWKKVLLKEARNTQARIRDYLSSD